MAGGYFLIDESDTLWHPRKRFIDRSVGGKQCAERERERGPSVCLVGSAHSANKIHIRSSDWRGDARPRVSLRASRAASSSPIYGDAGRGRRERRTRCAVPVNSHARARPSVRPSLALWKGSGILHGKAADGRTDGHHAADGSRTAIRLRRCRRVQRGCTSGRSAQAGWMRVSKGM